MKITRVFFIVPFLLFINREIQAQVPRDSLTAYTWFDQMVGQENTGLFDGIEYIEEHVTVNDKQKYLGSILFLPGSVVYKNEPYYNVELKYNVYDDLLLVKNKRGEAIQLHKHRIKRFELAGRAFENITDTINGKFSGFYEVLMATPQMELLKKHRKKRRKFLDRDFTYFEFTNDEPQYALYHHNQYHPLNTRREVIRAFPGRAAQIRELYRTHRGLMDQDKDRFMMQLLRGLDVSSQNF